MRETKDPSKFMGNHQIPADKLTKKTQKKEKYVINGLCDQKNGLYYQVINLLIGYKGVSLWFVDGDVIGEIFGEKMREKEREI